MLNKRKIKSWFNSVPFVWSVLMLSFLTIFNQIILAQNAQNGGEISLEKDFFKLCVLSQSIPTCEQNIKIDDGTTIELDISAPIDGMTVNVITPAGSTISSQNIGQFNGTYKSYEISSTSQVGIPSVALIKGFHQIFGLSNAQVGNYRIEIQAPQNNTQNLGVTTHIVTDSQVGSGIYLTRTEITLGQPLDLSVALFDGQLPIAGASITAEAVDENEARTSFSFHDDGVNGDASASDGLYTATYTPTSIGKQTIYAEINGQKSNGVLFERQVLAEISVLPSKSRFTEIYRDFSIDSNGDNLIDKIVFEAQTETFVAGDYGVFATLKTQQGKKLTRFSKKTLAVGTDNVQIEFAAKDLLKLGENGPYTIDSLRLVQYATDRAYDVDTKENVWQTQAYQLSQLQRPVVIFTGQTSVTGIDANGNGKFEFLRFQAGVNVLTPGTYQWSGSLVDSTGKLFADYEGNASFVAGDNQINLSFGSQRIIANNAPGPFTLINVLVANDNHDSAFANQLFETPAYTLDQFEGDVTGTVTADGMPIPLTTLPGQNARLSFVGTVGQRVFVRLSNNTIPGMTAVSLLKPDAVELISTNVYPYSAGYIDTQILPVSGVYTVLVDPSGESAGSLNVQVFTVPPDVSTAITPNGAPVTTSNTVPGQNSRLTFNAAAGQHALISLTNNNIPGNTDVFLLKPDGAMLSSTNLAQSAGGAIEVQSLPVAGTYTIVVDPLGSRTGSLTVQLTLDGAPGTMITPNGAPVTINQQTPGQNSSLTFNGTLGQHVLIGLSDNNISSATSVVLLKPDGTIFTDTYLEQNEDGSLEARYLPVTGTYTILIDPDDSGTGSLTVRLNTIADVTAPLTIGGAPVTATTTQPKQNIQLSFAATSGQHLLINLTNNNIPGQSEVTLIKSDGTMLSGRYVNFNQNDYFEALIPASGAYLVLVDLPAESTGGMTVGASAVADTMTTIVPNGAAVTVTTTQPNQNARLTFSGTTGQHVLINLTDNNIAPDSTDVYLLAPDGATAGYNYLGAGEADYLEAPALPSNGTYTILIDPRNDSLGSITVQVSIITDTTTAIVPNGAAVTVTTSTVGQNARLTFSGTAGQKMLIKLNNNTIPGYTYVSLLKPDGSGLASANVDSSSPSYIDPSNLPVTGIYTILVNPPGTSVGSMTVQLFLESSSTTAIVPNGAAVTVTTSTPGQNARLTFSGTAGQHISIDLSNNTIPGQSVVSVLNPGGTQLNNYNGSPINIYAFQNVNTTIDVPILPVTGTYTIIVDPSFGNTGSMTVKVKIITDATAAITAGGPQVTVTTSTPGQNARLTFNGTAGQVVSVSLSNNNITAGSFIALVKPDRTMLTGSSFYQNATGYIYRQTLPTAGSYTILVDPSGFGVGSITAKLNNITDIFAPITAGGAPVTINPTIPGQKATFSFNGTAGQRVLVKISPIFMQFGSGLFAFLKPDATPLAVQYGNDGVNTFIETVTLPVTGTYQINLSEMYPIYQGSGSVTVQIFDVPPDISTNITPDGGPVTITTTSPGQNAHLTFNGTMGQHILIKQTNSAGPQLLTVSPLNTNAGGLIYNYGYDANSLNQDIASLPVTGVYTILIDPYLDNLGNMTIEVQNISDVAVPITPNGAPVTVTTTTPGQNARLTFNGVANHHIAVSFNDITIPFGRWGINAFLIKPDGTIISSIILGDETITNLIEIPSLPYTGTYIILIDPYPPYIGSARVQLSDSTQSTLSSGKIIYSGLDVSRGKTQIFAINPDGAGRVNLSSSSGNDTVPVFSSDGSQIVFNRDGNLMVMNADGSNQRTLAGGATGDAPSWSPDNTRIIFKQWYYGVNPDLFVINADGTNLTRITNTADHEGWFSWSPIGDKIVFAKNGNIYLINPDGTNEILLKSGDDASCIAWSPNGQSLAWINYYTGELTVIQADGTNQKVLTGSAQTRGKLSWSPDSTKITYLGSYTFGINYIDDVFVVNVGNAATSRITNYQDFSQDQKIKNLSWSDDGSQIAFSRVTETPSIWSLNVMNADGGNQRSVSQEQVDGINPIWSPRSDPSLKVNLTSPVYNASFIAPAVINLSAAASDNEGNIIKVEFYQGTTKIGEDATAPYDFAWNNVAGGNYSLTAKAINNLGDIATSTTVVVKVNNAPSCAITSPADNSVFNAPANITITANASSADTTISRVEFYRGTTKLGQDTTAPYSYAWNNVAAGAYSITAKAIDNLGVSTTSAAVNVRVNTLPTVSITSPANNAQFTAPATVTINANASDADGTIAKVEFFRASTKLGESLTAPFSFTWTNAAAGTYSLTAKATDNNGGVKTSTAVSITVNAPPTASITAPVNNASFTAPASITINANASDSDGTVSKVEFYQGAIKLGQDTTSPYSFVWANAPAGTYSLTAKATDNLGATKTSAVITVKVNALPTASITAPANNASFTAPATVTINANASDADGTITKVEFFQGATKLGQDVTAPYSFVWSGVAVGTYSLTVIATDNSGGTKTSTAVTITVR